MSKFFMAAAGCKNNPASKQALLKDKNSEDVVLAVFIVKPSLLSLRMFCRYLIDSIT